MADNEREDLKKIRYYKGTVSDFKNFWDEMAGTDTNAFETPAYQGFNEVHPTRGDNQSPHWETTNLTEGKGYDEAKKVIDKLRSGVFRKLNDDELVEFRKEIAMAFDLKMP